MQINCLCDTEKLHQIQIGTILQVIIWNKRI